MIGLPVAYLILSQNEIDTFNEDDEKHPRVR